MQTHTTHRTATRENTGRPMLYTTLAAATVIGLVMSPAGDQGFFAIVFLGPVLTGLTARLLDISWKQAAAPWAISGIFMFTYDGLINGEDMATHAVLTVLMVALVALGALTARPLARLFARSASARA